jgi:ribosomal protein S8E
VNPEQPAISPILLRTTQINFINVPGIRKTTYFHLAISDITKHHKNRHLLQLNTEIKHAKVIITARNLASH